MIKNKSQFTHTIKSNKNIVIKSSQPQKNYFTLVKKIILSRLLSTVICNVNFLRKDILFKMIF